MGPKVRELEDQLGAFCGAKHTIISCASGTDVLSLPLMAEGIGPGDVVFVPAFNIGATAEMAALLTWSEALTNEPAKRFPSR